MFSKNVYTWNWFENVKIKMCKNEKRQSFEAHVHREVLFESLLDIWSYNFACSLDLELSRDCFSVNDIANLQKARRPWSLHWISTKGQNQI